MESYRFYYEVKKDGSLRLLRCFGETGQVRVPSQIRGLPVTEIGSYCFAENGHLEGKNYETEERGEAPRLAEQCGRYVTSVFLPDTLRLIDGYAFYNCRRLARLSASEGLKEIGNDAFMNCTSLQTLEIRGSIRRKTALKQMLAQITWQVEVYFREAGREPEAVLFFPEYSEYYDLIGPAHIFELLVQGEGFRARNCFSEGILKLSEYDGIFAKACAEENEKTLCRFALDRLQYPVDLGKEAENAYRSYIRAHALRAAEDLLTADGPAAEAEPALLQGQVRSEAEAGLEQVQSEAEAGLERVRQMAEQKLMDAETLEALTAWTIEKGKTEAAAALLKYKRLYFSVSRKKRYEF